MTDEHIHELEVVDRFRYVPPPPIRIVSEGRIIALEAQVQALREEVAALRVIVLSDRKD